MIDRNFDSGPLNYSYDAFTRATIDRSVTYSATVAPQEVSIEQFFGGDYFDAQATLGDEPQTYSVASIKMYATSSVSGSSFANVQGTSPSPYMLWVPAGFQIYNGYRWVDGETLNGTTDTYTGFEPTYQSAIAGWYLPSELEYSVQQRASDESLFANCPYYLPIDENNEQINLVFQSRLGRAPSSDELQMWNSIFSGDFLNAAEFDAHVAGWPEAQAYEPPPTTTPSASAAQVEFVSGLFNQYLGHAPDPEDLEFFLNALNNGFSQAEIQGKISTSLESLAYAKRPAQIDFLRNLYLQSTGIQPNDVNLELCIKLMNSGYSEDWIRYAIQNSSEALVFSGISGPPVPLSARNINENFVRAAYRQGVGKDPDQLRISALADAIDSGATRDQIIHGIDASPEAQLYRGVKFALGQIPSSLFPIRISSSTFPTAKAWGGAVMLYKEVMQNSAVGEPWVGYNIEQIAYELQRKMNGAGSYMGSGTLQESYMPGSDSITSWGSGPVLEQAISVNATSALQASGLVDPTTAAVMGAAAGRSYVSALRNGASSAQALAGAIAATTVANNGIDADTAAQIGIEVASVRSQSGQSITDTPARINSGDLDPYGNLYIGDNHFLNLNTHISTVSTVSEATGVETISIPDVLGNWGGGTLEVTSNIPPISYFDILKNEGQFGLGVGEGGINGVSEPLIGLAKTLATWSISVELQKLGVSPQDAVAISEKQTDTWWNGRVFNYESKAEDVGGVYGGVVLSPLVADRAIKGVSAALIALRASESEASAINLIVKTLQTPGAEAQHIAPPPSIGELRVPKVPDTPWKIDSVPLPPKAPPLTPEELQQLANVWQQRPIVRGILIEKFLALTEYDGWFNVGKLFNGKFPLVDFQKGNTLVSLKTVDTAGITWRSRMEEHIYELGHNGATVSDLPANMVLDLRVQPGGALDAAYLVQYGKENNVVVIIKEF